MPLLANPLIANPTIGGGSLVIGDTGGPTPLFAPEVGASFGFVPRYTRASHSFSSLKGYEQIRPIGSRTVRVAQVRWSRITTRQLDYIVSFFDQFEGARGPFYWVPPVRIHSPLGMSPVLGKTSGATGSGATYYVRFSWYSASAGTETEASKTSTITRVTGELMTVEVPVIPTGVDSVRLYIGTTPGNELREATITARTWTEPTSGFPVGGGAAPPTANNLSPTLRWVLVGDIAPVLIGCERWALDLEFSEQII